MGIGTKIKTARTENGITQEKAAEVLMVSRQTISNWENGKSLPDIVSVIKMSELYQISLDELLKGDNVMMKKLERDVECIKAQKMIIQYAFASIVIGAIILILDIVIEENPVIEFISGALPWVLLAFSFLIPILYFDKMKDNVEGNGE